MYPRQSRSLARSVSLLILALAALAPCRAADPPAPSPEEVALTLPEFARGDYDAAVRRGLDAVEHDPDAPLSEVTLRWLATLRGMMHHPQSLLPAFDKLARLPFKNGWNQSVVRIDFADLLEEAGRLDEADALRASLGFVDAWLAIGPYGRTEQACFDDCFPPETAADEALLTARGAPPGTPTWRGIPRVRPGRPIQLFESMWPREGAAYAQAQLQLPQATPAYVLVQAPGACKLWVNGTLAADVDRLRAVHPHEVAARVTLRAGWNRLLVKLVSGSSGLFRCRVVDADGRPIPGVHAETALELHPPAAPARDEPHPQTVRVGAMRHYAEAAAATDGRPAPWPVAALAFLHSFAGEEDDALGEMKRAVAAAPTSPFLHLYLGRLYEGAEFLPATFRANRAKDAFGRALELAPTFVPALEGISLYYYRDDKVEQAIETLKKALATEPKFFQGHLRLAGLYAGQGWQREENDELRAIEDAYPGAEAVLEHRIRRDRTAKLYPEAIRRLEAYAATHVSARDDLYDLYAAAGQVDRAVAGWESVLARDPDDLRALDRLQGLAAARGAWDDALKLNERRLDLVPGDPALLKTRADLLLKAGRRNEALALYEAALRRDPSQHALRRQLASLRGQEEDPEGEWAVDGRTLLANSPGRVDFPKAAVVYLLDQAVLRVHEDGSYSEVIHEIIKILNEKGIDKYDKVRIQGDILDARTISPEGSVSEPVLLPGANELTMPNLEDGSIIEYRFGRDGRRKVGNRFTYPAFYFQDFNFDGPFLRSRFVVITPKDFDLSWVERNMPGPPRVTEQGDRKVYVWDVVKSERIEQEPHQPGYDDFLPHVWIGRRDPWLDTAAQCKEFFFGRMIVTREIRERAAELVAGKATVREKLAALYAFVNDWVKDDEGGHTAQEILTERGGLRLVLLGALAEAAGLAPEYVFGRVNRWVEPEPPLELPSTEHFAQVGSTLTFLRVQEESGAYVWADTQSRYSRLGEVPWRFQGGRGMVIRRDGPLFVRLPEQPAEETAETQDVEVRLDAAGGADVRLVSITRGEQAARTRPRLITVSPEERKSALEQYLNISFPGLKLESVEMPDLEKPGTPLTVVQEFRLPRFADVAKKEARCRTGLPPISMQESFGSEPHRRLPLQLSRWYAAMDRARVVFPAGWRVRSVPESVALETNYGSYSLLYSRDAAGAVVVERRCLFPPQQIPAAEYEKFLDLCREIDAVEQKKIAIGIGE